MAARKRIRRTFKKSILYPVIGLLLSFTAPLGWLLYVGWHDSIQYLAELRDHTLLYLYMEVGAILILTLCGFALGWRDDRLHEHYTKLLSQRRLLSIKNRQLARLSITDALTGLANRMRLMEVLSTEYKRAKRYGSDLCLILVDIDHFKKINDTYGHLFGDFVLHEIGQIFASSRRDSDYVARTGGEEFCFVLTETHKEDAVRFAQRLLDEVANHSFHHGNLSTQVHISAGVASMPDLISSSDADDRGQRLLGLADEALYEAKRQGRNRVIPFAIPKQRRA